MRTFILVLMLSLSASAERLLVDWMALDDAKVIKSSGQYLVTLKPIFKALGARVSYSNGRIEAQRGDRVLQMRVGSTKATLNGVPVELEAAPKRIGVETYVPLKFVAEALRARMSMMGNAVISIASTPTVPPPEATPPPPVAKATPPPVVKKTPPPVVKATPPPVVKKTPPPVVKATPPPPVVKATPPPPVVKATPPPPVVKATPPPPVVKATPPPPVVKATPPPVVKKTPPPVVKATPPPVAYAPPPPAVYVPPGPPQAFSPLRDLKRLRVGNQGGILKVVMASGRGDALFRGIDDRNIARYSGQGRDALLTALGISNADAVASQLMGDYTRLPKKEVVALLGALGAGPIQSGAVVRRFLSDHIALEKDVVLRRQAVLALAVQATTDSNSVEDVLRLYEHSENLWETFTVQMFFEYQSPNIRRLPEFARVRSRVAAVNSLYTPYVLSYLDSDGPNSQVGF